MKRDIPVFTAHGCLDRSGTYYALDDQASPLFDQIQAYRALEYNYQFDKKNRIDSRSVWIRN